MSFGTHVVARNRHGAIGIDDERRTDHTYVHLAVELLFAVCAVQLVHGQVGIRQQREREMIALCKLAQLVKRVLGDAKHRNVFRRQSGEIVAEIASLGGAAGRHRGRVEIQHYLAAGLEHVRQVD